jgi:acetylglutamate kinase
VNKEVVELINQAGGKAVGLCGLDDGILKATKLLENGVDYGRVGEVTEVDTSLIKQVIAGGYIPVISTVAMGDDGGAFNINADTAAAKIAVALGAEKLILLTDVRGLLRNPKDPETLISMVSASEVPALVHDGIITGGMIPKVDCCVEAVRRGVKRAHIIDGRIPNSVLIEMLSDEGIGTMIV